MKWRKLVSEAYEDVSDEEVAEVEAAIKKVYKQALRLSKMMKENDLEGCDLQMRIENPESKYIHGVFYISIYTDGDKLAELEDYVSTPWATNSTGLVIRPNGQFHGNKWWTKEMLAYCQTFFASVRKIEQYIKLSSTISIDRE